jgi:translation elongation factor EF-G
VTFQKRIHLYGHVSAQPTALAQIFGAEVSGVAIAESDLAIFAINPSAGIDQATIDLWQALSVFQLPRLVLVNELAGSDSDFEDAVMLANRVFDQLVTPYLVLHSDIGEPIALISLDTLEIIDYRDTPPQISMSEPEHQDLVSEFRSEYLEEIAAAGEDAFVNGLLFPAIPIVVANGMGIDIVKRYISTLH